MLKRLQERERRESPRQLAGGKIAFLLLLALAFPAALFAASFSISFDQNPITAGDSVAMTMTFEGGQPVAIPAPPGVAGLRILDAHAESSSIQIDNGNVIRKFVHTFTVTPNGPGDFVIPSLQATIGGQVCKSEPVTLKVLKPGAPPAGLNPENPDIAFMRLEVPKTTVYLGEVIRAELQIHIRDTVAGFNHDFQMNPPQVEGFTIGKTVEVPHRQVRVGNVRYNVIPLVMTYTAAKVGKLTIAPTDVSMTLLFGPVNFFGQPTRSQHITLSNQPVEIQSLPLPMENIPPGFSGAVGKYTMNLSVSPTNVAIGDPITVKVDISGKGALDGIRLPTQMGWDRFKLYPPTAQFEVNPGDPLAISGTMHFALTAVPENMDVNELPPFIFTFFDPDAKTYQTLSHPAVPLVVRPSAASLPAPALSGNSTDNPGSVQDVSPIKPRLGELAQLSPPLVGQPWFLMLQVIPALAWVSLLVRRQQREHLASNPRLRRRKQVEQTLRTGLKDLRESANAGDSEAFFATVFRLLQEQLGERLDLPGSAITEAVLDERLRPLGVPEEQLAELRELFQACNQARYARQATNAELVSMIPRVESALNQLKKVQA